MENSKAEGIRARGWVSDAFSQEKEWSTIETGHSQCGK